ncbi:MAG: glycerophosphodiester phosphodiesterase [Burkholderiales bacterium]
MTPWPLPFWIAHRGAGKAAPENTLAAFQLGLASGFRAFECDVQLSLDGTPFLLHDDLLDRTSNGSGLACDLTWATLAALDAGSWHSPAFAGEPLLSLAGLAELAREHQLQINLELKPSPGQAQRVGAGVAAWLREHWKAPTPLLSSFEPEALLAAAGQGWPLALLCEAWSDDALPLAQQLGCVAVVCHHASLSQAAIAKLHSAQLRALTYTVNDASEAQRLIEAGLDGLITDQLDLPASVASAQQSERAN